MNKFLGYAIYSDMDNTMLAPDGTIAERNITALTRFTDEGGRFAIASGRGPTQVTYDLLDRLPMVNSPCIFLNGAMLYDARKRSVLSFVTLPECVRPWLFDLHRRYPQWPVSVCTESDRFQIGPDVEKHVTCKPVEDINDPWGKLLLHVSVDTRETAMQWLREQHIAGVDITACDTDLVEIVPQGVSKGAALERVIGMFSLDRAKVAAAGDYLNDLIMLKTPGIRAFCPEVSAPEVKAVCEKTLCSVYDGVLADIVEIFEGEIDAAAKAL